MFRMPLPTLLCIFQLEIRVPCACAALRAPLCCQAAAGLLSTTALTLPSCSA